MTKKVSKPPRLYSQREMLYAGWILIGTCIIGVIASCTVMKISQQEIAKKPTPISTKTK